MDSHKNNTSCSQDLKINHAFFNKLDQDKGEEAKGVGRSTTSTPPVAVAEGEESGRERLKRHRGEMAGRVWIPDIWGQEDLLNEWIDCSVFDSSLGKTSSILSARKAMVKEASRSTHVVRIENRC